jgi:protein arginine kinase activator
MKCDLCGKKATVHLTEIVDDQLSEMHLCENCAQEKSVQMEQQFGLADLLAGLADFGKQPKGEEKITLECSRCGLNYDDFRKFGRLGCSECYKSFKIHLSTLLKKIHGSNHHFGKAPVGMSKGQKENIVNIQDLKQQLQKAIMAEDFEAAATLRDQIRDLEKKEAK